MARSIRLLVFAACSIASLAWAGDPHQWLEDVNGKKALAWVRSNNASTVKELASSTEFKQLETRLRAILDRPASIPYVSKHGAWFYNLWRDAKHERGLWRRTTPAEYRKPEPTWQTVLDLDALAATEHESWVFQQVTCLEPEQRRCLIELSRGGADAIVAREYDVEDRAFVKGGFSLPEAKGSLHWRDHDSVLVDTDFGPGSLTDSGYPRITKLWRRGTPLSSAQTIFEGKTTDLAIAAGHDQTPGFERDFVYRDLTMTSSEILLWRNGKLTRVEAPVDAKLTMVREWLFVELRSDWEVGGQRHPAGSLLATRFEDFIAGRRVVYTLFTPSARVSLLGMDVTRHAVIVHTLDEVRDRFTVLRWRDGNWRREVLPPFGELTSVEMTPVDPDETDDYFLTVSGLTTPARLYYGSLGGGAPELLKEEPSQFDAGGLEVTQHFARSADGTRVPYFQVARTDLVSDGNNPTLLSGYGGFEESMRPAYDGLLGAAWLEQHGVYVLANIRGGGEFGPAWHEAAVRDKRPRAYEDFIAVAEDLIARQVTSPRHLGIEGSSNGGLLVGNMLVRRPDLWGAIAATSGLFDMRRYNKLLAGASWMSEFGDPDVPEDWKFIEGISPYHRAKADVVYPRMLLLSSTRDDRVHPGHSRKMVAKLKAQHHDVLLYENIEGGHGAAASHHDAAFMSALEYTFFGKLLR